MSDLIPAPKLEALLESHGCPQAVDEYRRLREMTHLLGAYFVAGKRHTDATVAALHGLSSEVEPSAATKFAWR